MLIRMITFSAARANSNVKKKKADFNTLKCQK